MGMWHTFQKIAGFCPITTTNPKLGQQFYLPNSNQSLRFDSRIAWFTSRATSHHAVICGHVADDDVLEGAKAISADEQIGTLRSHTCDGLDAGILDLFVAGNNLVGGENAQLMDEDSLFLAENQTGHVVIDGRPGNRGLISALDARDNFEYTDSTGMIVRKRLFDLIEVQVKGVSLLHLSDTAPHFSAFY